MGIYNFQPRFVPKILSGEKTHTIRATRKHPDKPGKTLHLYTGLRHKGARLLMRAKCVKVESIRIAICFDGPPLRTWVQISINGEHLDHDEMEALARRDGFSSLHEILIFWDGRLPFNGQIIHWQAPGPAVRKRSRSIPSKRP